MFGTILKYTTVLVIGGIGFAAAGNWMDDEAIENAKLDIENYREKNAHASAEELADLTRAYIVTNRKRWVDSITFASRLKDLEAILNAYN